MDSSTMTPNPSFFLPPLLKISHSSAASVEAALLRLQDLYWPSESLPRKPLPNRVIQRLFSDSSVPDSGYASVDEDEDGLGLVPGHGGVDDEEDIFTIIRSDPFERDFSVRWLTGFICRSDTWIASCDENEADVRANLVDFATSTLARFSSVPEDQDQETCSLTRLFEFPTAGSSIVQVELNDAPLSNSDHTSVGLQSWASCIVLAERMCLDPESFGLRIVPGGQLKILELGAGTGLLSIAIAQLLPSSTARIVATDFHPDVLANLRRNVDTNAPRSSCVIEVEKLDWEAPLLSPLGVEHGQFDVILAADVIYDARHALWIKECLEHFLAPGGLFSLVIPIRTSGRHEGLHCTVDHAFADTRGSSLTLLRAEEQARKAGVGRVDEAGYRFFQVGFI